MFVAYMVHTVAIELLRVPCERVSTASASRAEAMS